ncbi:MAG: RsmD family RNA methyltransferase [Bacteroidales bacterium]|nr:RsmD family RNA methyltransferase [Bacteroidales bacterium]MCL2737874.1 RsmD family RNA methyltransferase [Bacteroidales bacterium]
MRIIGGLLKGREVHAPKLTARPTTDFAKEGLFNILANQYDFESLQVLDLFGGSGSISFEFASRGCPQVTCVEINHIHASFIKETAMRLGLKAIRVVRHNVFDFIPICTQSYDLIFADPPFDLHQLTGLPSIIQTASLLRPGGCFILEHSGAFDFSQESGFRKMRKYGQIHFSFFSFEPPTA